MPQYPEEVVGLGNGKKGGDPHAENKYRQIVGDIVNNKGKLVDGKRLLIKASTKGCEPREFYITAEEAGMKTSELHKLVGQNLKGCGYYVSHTTSVVEA